MAGIGFELRKLVETRTIRGVLGAAFSGTIVVAGPWLVSAASIAAAQRLPFFSGPGIGLEFTGAMVWAFALSICLSAAPLYLFVRLTSDLVYEKKKGEAATLLLKYSGGTALVSLPVGLALAWLSVDPARDATLLRLSFAMLFAALNVLWAATMTATVVRRHGRILASYAAGMLAMYVLARFLGPRYGAGGGVAALAAGYALTAVALVFTAVGELGRRPYPGALKRMREYAHTYRFLALAGLLYAAATWIDKGVLSLGGQGIAAAGTRFFTNPPYDTAFYYANLSLIPGLVFFTISTETQLYLGLRRFVSWLGSRRLPDIERAKSELYHGTASILARQTAVQALVSLGLALLVEPLAASMGISPTVLLRLLAAGVFQLMLLSGLNLLFYLELYRDAALSAFCFAALNLALSLAAVLAGRGPELAGLPFLCSCVVSSALALFLGFRGIARFDRIVFLRATGAEYGK
jgi:uncharacterized membrane protein